MSTKVASIIGRLLQVVGNFVSGNLGIEELVLELKRLTEKLEKEKA